jgi:hypothetical protein
MSTTTATRAARSTSKTEATTTSDRERGATKAGA